VRWKGEKIDGTTRYGKEKSDTKIQSIRKKKVASPTIDTLKTLVKGKKKGARESGAKD